MSLLTVTGAFTTLLTLATAQQSQSQPILQIPFYGYDTQSIDASVVGVSNFATTLELACPPGIDSNDCGLFPSQTLIYGPSTYHMVLGVGTMTEAFAGAQDCSRAGTSSAVCMESYAGSEANDPGMSTTVYGEGDVNVLSVTVTAGAERLGASAGAAAVGSVSATATSGSVPLVSGAAGASSSVASGSRSDTPTQSAAASGSSSAAGSTKRLEFGAIAAVVGSLGWMVQ